MANIPVTNYPSALRRSGEVAGSEQWENGMNYAGCTGLGIATSVLVEETEVGSAKVRIPTPNTDNSPDTSDQQSSPIGGGAGDGTRTLYDVNEAENSTAGDGTMTDDNNVIRLLQAGSDVAPGGDMGGGYLNRSGKTVRAGEWTYAVLPVA